MPEQPISSSHTDDLSPLARQILSLDIENSYRRLVVRGDGNSEAKTILSAATPKQLLSGLFRSQDDANAMLAGLWLWHDWLDESHHISQSLNSASGSFWHAIMHRREGDFSNSKYWYARCQNHPILRPLAIQASDVINPYPADKEVLKLTRDGTWNAPAFVDLIETVHGVPADPRHALAVALQQ